MAGRGELQLLEDVQEECGKYGTVEGIAVPRPPEDVDEEEMGRVYVKFASSEEVQSAKDIFHNRQFDGFSIQASFAPEEDFERASMGEWVKDEPPEPALPAMPPPPGILLPSRYRNQQYVGFRVGLLEPRSACVVWDFVQYMVICLWLWAQYPSEACSYVPILALRVIEGRLWDHCRFDTVRPPASWSFWDCSLKSYAFKRDGDKPSTGWLDVWEHQCSRGATPRRLGKAPGHSVQHIQS
jgi:hypothetical protein